MKYVYKKTSGVTNSINIPDTDIVGKSKEDFVRVNTEWWATAHRVSNEFMAEKLGALWDIANPPKPKTKSKLEPEPEIGQ